MTIKELFITSNETEQKVVEQIADHQWELMMPEKITRTPNEPSGSGTLPCVG
jgi:hypothetical protein